MDWETFFQGLKDTRTGGGLFVVTLLLVLLAPFGFCLLAEGIAACCSWVMAMVSGVLDFGPGVGLWDAVSFVVRCILFLSLIGLAALVLVITRDRLQRFRSPASVGFVTGGDASAERGCYWGRSRAPSDQIRCAPRTRHSARVRRREDC